MESIANDYTFWKKKNEEKYLKVKSKRKSWKKTTARVILNKYL